MAEVQCEVGDFYHMVMDMFGAMVDETMGETTAEIYAAADDAAKELRAAKGIWSQEDDLPERERLHYERGWKAYKHKEVDGHVMAVVANANAPQLTHLVEFGHELFLYGHDTGRRTDERPHIRKAYENARDKHWR